MQEAIKQSTHMHDCLYIYSKESNQLHVLLVARVRLMSTIYTNNIWVTKRHINILACVLSRVVHACSAQNEVVVVVVVFIALSTMHACMHVTLPASKAVVSTPQSNILGFQLSTMNTLMHNEC